MGKQAELLLSVVAKKARTDFRAFCYLMAKAVPTTPPIVISACHELLMEVAQGAYYGNRSKRQCVSMPPQHGKSTFLSTLFPLWLMGVRSGISVAITGFSHELVTDFSMAIKALMDTREFKMVFPECSVQPKANRAEYWRTTTNCIFRAKATGKKLTGRKVDVLIADDVHAGREEAESTTKRRRVQKWFFSDCISRLSPDPMVLVIGTRWHPEDLIGLLTSEEYNFRQDVENEGRDKYEVTNLTAVCDNPDNDPLGREYDAPLFPEVRHRKFLQSQKAGMPIYDWESSYMGRPRSSGSGQIDVARLVRVALTDIPAGCEFVRGWDLALSEKKASDFTVGALLAYHKLTDILYLVDIYRARMVWPKAKEKIIETAIRDAEEFGLCRVGLEGVSGFEIAIEEVRPRLRDYNIRVEKKNPTTDKLLRAQPWLNKAEAGKIMVVGGKWNRDFFDEMDMFPDSTHDDQVDAVSIAYECFVKRNKLVYA